MTRALYRDMPARLHFTATVTATDGPRAELDATAFYPEGGGQPGDVGRVAWDGGHAAVTATRRDRATGRVWHELTGPVPPVGATVTGDVDAAVRWRHSQRHSGEHLLAQAFARVNAVFAVEAVSMTSPECTLDLRGDPAPAHVHAAETLLRETLGRHDLRLRTPEVDPADLGAFPLRRPAKVAGRVRLVIFEDDAGVPFDVSACGGTHVPRAAMAGPVVVLRTERIRGGLTRVVFMAGEEAAAYVGGVYRDARALAQTFSVPPARLTERVDALRAELDAAVHAAARTRRALAGALVAAAPTAGPAGRTLRSLTFDDDALLLDVLGVAGPDGVVAAVTPSGRCGVAGGGADVDAGALLRAALAQTGGRGGGRPDLAQGHTERPDAFLHAVALALSAP